MQINSKIKPLISDLEKTNIGSYLASSGFERLTVTEGFDTMWDAFYRVAEKKRRGIFLVKDIKRLNSEYTLVLLLNGAFQQDQEIFYAYVYIIFSGYIDWVKNLVEMEDIFSDLEILDFPIKSLIEMKENYNTKVNEIKSQEVKRIKVKEKEEENKIDFLAIIKTKKDEWIDKISIAKTEETITELKDFALETKNNDLIGEIINQSQRWHRLQRKIRDNVLDLDKEQIECNKINKALLEIISTLENK